MFDIAILETVADVDAIADEWNALHEQISPRLPFSTPRWVVLWWQAYRRTSGSALNRLCIFTLRDPSGTLVAVAPMFVSTRPSHGPIRMRELQFIGSDSNVTEVRGPLCQPALAVDVFNSISRFTDDENIADWIQWRGLRCDTSELPVRLDVMETLGTQMYVLRLPASWEALKASLTRNMREALRKCYNSLAREGATFSFVVVDSPAEVDAALSRFFELHELRASLQNAVPHPNVFKGERSRQFLRAYCAAMAEADQLRLFQIVIAGEVVACRIGFQFGSDLYLYYSGYDLNWGRFSVMTTVVAEAMKWAIGNKLSIVNLSTGTDISKTRWQPECITFFGGTSTRAAVTSAFKRQVAMMLRGWK